MEFPLQAQAYSQFQLFMIQVYHRVTQLLQLLEAASGIASEGSSTDCLSFLNQAVGRHPNQAPALLPQLLTIFSDMLAQKQQFQLGDYAGFYSLILKVFTALPPEFHSLNEQMLTAAVLALSNIEEADEEWSQPAESEIDGEVEVCENMELRVCREVLEEVGQFTNKVGSKIGRAYFAPIFIKYVNCSTDWREKYGALMVASQLVVESEELQQVKCFVEAAQVELHSPHPKVRFAALELVGQLSQHLKPVFQEEYFDLLVPHLLKLLINNPPRIICHAFACLTNFFFEFRHFWKVEAIINDLLTPIVHYLKEGTPSMQECVLDVVRSLGGIRGCLGPSVGVLVQACGQFLQQQSQLRRRDMLGEVFNSLSVLLCGQNQQQVGQYISHFVDSLLANHKNINDESFLETWRKICEEYKKFVDLEATGVLKLILGKVDKAIKQEIEETSLLALDALSSTFNAFQMGLRPYTLEIYQFSKALCENKEYELPIRNRALKLIVELFLATQPVEHRDEHFVNEAMNILQFLIVKGDESITAQGSPRLLVGVLEGMVDLIEPLGASLTKETMIHISDRLLAYKQHIQEVVGEQQVKEEGASTHNNHDGDSSFEEVTQEDEEYTQQLLQIVDLIPDIYTKMLTVSAPPDRQMLISILIPQISFSVGKEDHWKSFALTLAISLVEGCSYEDLSTYWGDLMSLFSSFITHSQVQLRSPSVYGCGLIFQKTPPALVSVDNINTWLQALWGCLNAPFNQDEEKNSVGYCKDNVIAALGKLLNNCGPQFSHVLTSEVYQKWLQNLPLKFDSQEEKKQLQILLEMLNSNPNLLLSDAEGLKRVLEIISSYFLMHSHEKHNQTLLKSKQCFVKMTQWQLFQRSSEFLWNSLSTDQRTALTRLTAIP